MDSTTLICKRCKAPLEYEEGSSVARCPNCGYTELIEETETLKMERIRAKAYKDTELGRSKLEKEAAIAEKELGLEEKRLGLKKIRTILLSIVAVSMALFGIWAGFKIKHRNEIRIPMESDFYCQRSYSEVSSLLEDAGFSNLEYVVQETLSKNEQQLAEIVTQVSINGTASFKAREWFPKDSVVKVTYRVLDPKTKDDIEIPISSVDCIGKKYQIISEEFNKAGFKNIKFVSLADLNMDHQAEDEKITEIKIDNNTSFHQGDFFASEATIYITYHTIDPERMTDVKIPNDYRQYTDANYLEVSNDFLASDFTNITLIPKYDIGITEGAKNGIVQSVSVNGEKNFLKGKWLPSDTEVRIVYRSKEFKYIGEKYQAIEKQLEDIGFTNIICTALGDLGIKELKRDGDIESITIGGEELSRAAELNFLAPVEITYHSEKYATDSQVKINTNSKELDGEAYESVVKIFKEMGFTNIKATALEDISKDILRQDGKVKEVSINGTTKFSEGEIFERDADVIVFYHSHKPEETTAAPEVNDQQVLITTSSKDLEGKNYQDVITILSEMGFVNFEEIPMGDLKKGWLHKDGEVKEVVIAGVKKYSINDVFNKDDQVIIRYHSYPR